MKILIVRVSSLGDVVHNLPMLADIRRHYPEAHIDWVVEEAYTSLVRLNPHVCNIIPIALRRWRKSLGSASTRAGFRAFYRHLRQERYDVVLDTQGLLKTGVIMCMARLAEGGRRIGLANATAGSGYEAVSRIFHTQSITVGLYTHAVMRARVVAAAALGYELGCDAGCEAGCEADAAAAAAADFAMQQVPGLACLPAQPYAVFFHGTACATKEWPVEHWVAVAQALNGWPVLLPWGSAKEKAAAEQLAARMPQATVLPALSLLEAIALAQHAALVVGLDTGLTHVAAACCRPTVELYCDSPRWKTAGNWSPRIANVGDKGEPPDVAQVLAAIDMVLSSGCCRSKEE